MRQQEVSRFYFDLSEAKPIHVLVNRHQDLQDRWFDMHYEFEVGVLISGRMKRQYLAHERLLQPGEVWLCGMWEPHGFELLELPCELVVFVIDPRYVAGSQLLNRDVLTPFQLEAAARPQIPPERRPEVVALAQHAKALFERQVDADWAKLLFFQLMLLLLEHWQPPAQHVRNFALEESIQPALRLVFEERRLITTAEAARCCHLSQSGFRTRFQDLMGTSFSDFALQYRLRGALAQLKDRGDTLEAVAEAWGFADASHLHKYVRKVQHDR
ncbi:AraC-type DNA-binding protein [Catalinimonas alkaloidigena]|uniref:AraC-type DNA-binding protein n=1 Tax=Catalinimonas alkaloidigena TaxID=1075417 RepID=A0A1G8ZVR2_9BACT|nr:helix-turn-helix transcriptional regulator [Catalinimonas alkaloidigena]SDK18210.1 AraC-type DNA-binding protein [Catalinimonas alkaloidigena]